MIVKEEFNRIEVNMFKGKIIKNLLGILFELFFFFFFVSLELDNFSY